jgi:Domain of unknown function (DUF4383)
VEGAAVVTVRPRVGRTPGQLFALIIGAVYVLVGILGFIRPLAPGGKLLSVFGINPLHNIVHLVVGALLLFGSTSAANARIINLIVGIVYLLVGLLGLFNVLVPSLIANNSPDTGLHLVTGILALIFATVGTRRSVATV